MSSGGGGPQAEGRRTERGRALPRQMMRTDAYGLPATTVTGAALARYDEAVKDLLGWGRGALDGFHEAARLDPGLGLAHAGAAICLFLEERFAPAREAAEQARAAVSTHTARERSHVEAVALLVGGRPGPAEQQMKEHLEAWPRDVVVLQRLYFVWFWQGRFPEILGLTTRLLPAYGEDSFVLGLHAFALEQADRCQEAVRTAERAMARNTQDAWAVHARGMLPRRRRRPRDAPPGRASRPPPRPLLAPPRPRIGRLISIRPGRPGGSLSLD